MGVLLRALIIACLTVASSRGVLKNIRTVLLTAHEAQEQYRYLFTYSTSAHVRSHRSGKFYAKYRVITGAFSGEKRKSTSLMSINGFTSRV